MTSCRHPVALAGAGLVLLLAVLPPPATAAEEAAPGEAATPAEFERNVEWFGMNLGGGVLLFNLGAESTYGISTTKFQPQADLLLFNLTFPGWYLTPLEVHPVFFLGTVGGGVRVGGRVPLSGDGRHELRLGSYVGCDGVLFHINAFHPTLALQPHLQYVYRTDLGSVGAGLDALLFFHFRDEMVGDDGHTVSVPPLASGVSLYFRWTVGRTGW